MTAFRFLLCSTVATVLSAGSLGAQTIRGVVYDSLMARGPLVGARVVLDGVEQSATTDRRGRFRLDDVPEGTHMLTFYHPALDSARLSAPAYRVTVPRGGLRNLRLATPSYATTSQFLCGTTLDSASTIVLGRARSAEDGRPLAGATARVAWWELSFGDESGARHVDRRMTVQADSLGEFRLCGVPTDIDLTMTVQMEGQQSGQIVFPDRVAAITLRDVAVSLSDSAASVRADSLYGASPDSAWPGGARLRVRVLDERNRPVENAVVGVLGHGAAGTSDATGVSLIRGAPAGSQTVVVRAIGRAPLRRVVALAPGAETALEMKMSAVAALLPEYRVTGIRPGAVVEGFERRQRSGSGTFLDKERLDRIGRRAGYFQFVGGLRVPLTGGPMGYTPYPMFQLRGAEGGYCTPTIWIDGMPRLRMDGWELHHYLQFATRMEIYPRGMSIPSEFALSSGRCGVVVIWTQR